MVSKMPVSTMPASNGLRRARVRRRRLLPAKRYWLCSACGQAAARADVLSRSAGEARLSCRNWWCAADDRPVDAIFAVASYNGAFRKAIVDL